MLDFVKSYLAPGKTKTLCWVIFVMMAGCGGVCIVCGRGAPGQSEPIVVKPAVPVSAAYVETHDVPIYLEGLGTVQAFNSVTVHAMIDGPLTEISFQEGQDVRAGDILARIDPRPYQATLSQDIAKKAQDEAALVNARIDLKRYQGLAQTKSIATQIADTQRAVVAADEAMIQQDQALIDGARTQLSYTVIRSPIDGRTGIRQIDVGNIVHPSDSTGIVIVTQIKPIYVSFSLPQQTLPQILSAIKNGPVDVVALVESDLNDEEAIDRNVIDRGRLVVLDNEVDASTGTLKLRASFPNESLTLWPGAFVMARLRLSTLKSAMTVPKIAVQHDSEGAFVYVVDAHHFAARRPIIIGHEDQTNTVVQSGVVPGEQVVTEGVWRLADGDRVEIVSAEGMAPPATDSNGNKTLVRRKLSEVP